MARGKILELSQVGMVARAVSQVGKDVRYVMGAGGNNPSAKGPGTAPGVSSDCVGFVAWACGFDRYQPGRFEYYGGWINTDSMLLDATGKQGFFKPMLELIYPHLIVYPSTFREGKRVRVGHVGLVVDAGRVVHCSAGNQRRLGRAIDYGPESIWTRHPACARLLYVPPSPGES